MSSGVLDPHAPLIAVRPFHMYGPGEAPARFVPSALSSAAQDLPTTFGNPSLRRDFVYVDDAADAVIRALEMLSRNDLPPRLALNLATGVGLSLAQVAREASRVVGRPDYRHIFQGVPPLPGFDPPDLVGDPTLAEQWLGWRATTTLADGLTATWKSIITRPSDENECEA